MNSEKITPEQLLEHIEKEFHDSNKLWQESAVLYANSGLKIFDDMIKFVYQALTAMGLVSGFGFAGIQGVKNLYLFGIGEFVMFSAMVYGMYKIKYIYEINSNSVEDKSIKIQETFKEKALVLSEMMREVKEQGSVKNVALGTRYENANKEIYEIFGVEKKPVKQKDESWFINYMLAAFVIGFIILLLSFLPIKHDPGGRKNFHGKESIIHSPRVHMYR